MDTETVQLPPAQQVIYDALVDGKLAPGATNADIAALASCHVRTAVRNLRQLEQRGLIQLTWRPPNLDGFGTDPSGRTIHVTSRAGNASPATSTATVCAESAAAAPLTQTA